MNAGTVALVFCLASLVIGEPCEPKRKPSFDCKKAPASGVFFPHPTDCTYLIVCIAGQDVAVSLCDESEFGNVYDPKYSLGCPAKCDQVQPGCETSSTPPLFVTTTPSAPSSTNTTPEITPTSSTIPDTTKTIIPVTEQTTPPPDSASTATTLSTTTQTATTIPLDMTCKRGGMAAHPGDCKKTLICPSANAQAIVFNICENVERDSTFPVGCPEQCPGWRPGVFSV